MTDKAVKLHCPHCGATLSVSESKGKSITCSFCGTSLTIQKSEGTFLLSELGDAMSRVQAGAERATAELALRRLSEELVELRARRVALVEARNDIAAARGTVDAGRRMGLGCLVLAAAFSAFVALNVFVDTRRVLGFVALCLLFLCVGVLLQSVRKRKARIQDWDVREASAREEVLAVESRIEACEARLAEKRALADA